MIKIIITEDEENQRLDRFLKKYFKNAPLSHIYKLIRKDIKVNGKRSNENEILCKGDVLTLYMDEQVLENLKAKEKNRQAKKQFTVLYEDGNLLAVDKPMGLLTHGDSQEKKNHLANQVISYLIERGEYVPGRSKTFVPAPVNRLDRNTTGIVLFGKNYKALQCLNQMMRAEDYIHKYYLAIVSGHLKETLYLKDKMEKDSQRNKVQIIDLKNTGGKLMETIARPIEYKNGHTLVEVEILTGRTHQIRVHLSSAGYPILGDSKYGRKGFGKLPWTLSPTTQLLHAYRIAFTDSMEPLENLKGLEVKSQLPPHFQQAYDKTFGLNRR